MTETEIWKTIDGYETYSVSTFGNVRNDVTERIKKPNINTVGYLDFDLYKNNKRKHHSLHRLIAIAFIPNSDNKNDVDHIDNNRLNNSIENLRWTTRSENICNSIIKSTNTSGIKGVGFHKKSQKWRATITINGINKHIGSFNTIEEATIARQSKANEIFGAYTNACEKF